MTGHVFFRFMCSSSLPCSSLILPASRTPGLGPGGFLSGAPCEFRSDKRMHRARRVRGALMHGTRPALRCMVHGAWGMGNEREEGRGGATANCELRAVSCWLWDVACGVCVVCALCVSGWWKEGRELPGPGRAGRSTLVQCAACGVLLLGCWLVGGLVYGVR